MPTSRHYAQALPETSPDTAGWFGGWVAVMQRLEARPPSAVEAARPKQVHGPAKPSRTRIWIEAKAARMAAVQATRPPVEPWQPSEPQLEPGRFYEPAEAFKSTEQQLAFAIRAYGRTGGVRAHWYLGTELFEAIPSLGDGWHWAWLCQQHVARLPQIADRLDRMLGRQVAPKEKLPLVKDSFGGGQYVRNQTQVAPQLEEPAQAKAIICEELRGRVKGYDFWVDELTHQRLTAGDWRRIIGHGLKQSEQGRLNWSFRSWLKQVASNEARQYAGYGRAPEDAGDPD